MDGSAGKVSTCAGALPTKGTAQHPTESEPMGWARALGTAHEAGSGACLDLGRLPKILVVIEEPGLHQPPGLRICCGHRLHVSHAMLITLLPVQLPCAAEYQHSIYPVTGQSGQRCFGGAEAWRYSGRVRHLVYGRSDIGEVGRVVCRRLHLVKRIRCIEADWVTAKLLPKSLCVQDSQLITVASAPQSCYTVLGSPD